MRRFLEVADRLALRYTREWLADQQRRLPTIAGLWQYEDEQPAPIPLEPTAETPWAV